MLEQQIAEILLDKRAVLLNPNEPFQWASGIQSPIYCDNRQILSYPRERKIIAKALAEQIKREYPDVTAIAGIATAGIPHAAWVSELLDLPMIYVRGSVKKHGRKQAIEGHLRASDQIVLVEDLISTGQSVLDAARLVRQSHEVLGVVSIFSYQFEQARQNFKQQNLSYTSLSNLPILIQVAQARRDLTQEEVVLINQWYERYK